MRSGMYLINGVDAYDTYGVMLDYDSLGVLMAPPAMKTAISNDSPNQHGTDYSPSMPMVKERSVTLTFRMWAKTQTDAQNKHDAFCAMLVSAPFTLKVLRTGVTYNLRYKSSSGYVPWFKDEAKYTLSVIEPNPNNHAE